MSYLQKNAGKTRKQAVDELCKEMKALSADLERNKRSEPDKNL